MTSSSYILEGQSSELAEHAGHRVEITGTLESDRSGSGSTSGASGRNGDRTGSTGSTASGATGSTSTGTSATGTPQRVRVQSVRMLSSTCS